MTEFCGTMVVESEKAYLFSDGVENVWLPKSMVNIEQIGRKADYVVTLPVWLARRKGII